MGNRLTRLAFLTCVASCVVVPQSARGLTTEGGNAASTDAALDLLDTVPELIGPRLRHVVPVLPTADDTCHGDARRVEVVRGDVPVLTWSGASGTWTIDAQPTASEAGRAILPHDLDEGVHHVCVETPEGTAAIDLEIQPAVYTQISLNSLAADGTTLWRSLTSSPISGTAVVSRQWIMSDFAHNQGVWDAEGRELSVDVDHDKMRQIYRFDATLVEPVPAGELLVLEQRGISEPTLVTQPAEDELEYAFTHSPNSGVPTRRVELFVLPAGAELLEAEGFDVTRERGGHVELMRTSTVEAGGHITTGFRFRLEGARLAWDGPQVVASVPAAGATAVDPALKALRVTFDRDMRDRSWSWVQVDPERYPKTRGEVHYVDARTCVLPVKLKPDTDYVVWINKGRFDAFRDTDGHPSRPFELHFHTAAR